MEHQKYCYPWYLIIVNGRPSFVFNPVLYVTLDGQILGAFLEYVHSAEHS